MKGFIEVDCGIKYIASLSSIDAIRPNNNETYKSVIIFSSGFRLECINTYEEIKELIKQAQ